MWMMDAILTWAFQLVAVSVLIPTTYYLFDRLSSDIFKLEAICHKGYQGHDKCQDHDEMSFLWKFLPLLALAAWHMWPVTKMRRGVLTALDQRNLDGPLSFIISCCFICSILFNNHFIGLNLWTIDLESDALHMTMMFLHGLSWLWIVSSALGWISSKDFYSNVSPKFSVSTLFIILFWCTPCMTYDRFVDATLFTIFSLFFRSQS